MGAFLCVHHVTTHGFICANCSIFVMCEGMLLWLLVKEPDYKLPFQYSWEIVAQPPFKLGHILIVTCPATEKSLHTPIKPTSITEEEGRCKMPP